MAIRVALHHVTEYRYDRTVDLLPHVVRLRPAPHCRTPILSYSLRIRPEEHFLNWQQDPYSNYLARLVFNQPAQCLRVEVDLIADMTVINPFNFFVDSTADVFPFQYDPVTLRELAPYLETAESGTGLKALVEELRRSEVGTVDYLVDLNHSLQTRVDYIIRLEPGIQSCEETLETGRGSCRDSAWLLVQVLRHLGLAARFTSGYLIQLRPDVPSLDGPTGASHDFTDLHAWAEVYLPGAGWIGLDPTSGLLAGEGHIPLACAADPISAAPITGSFSYGGIEKVKEEFSFDLKLERIVETPPVTLPYTEEQWEAVVREGQRLDRRLSELDVRLSMGGEPTFVSVDDMDGEEWNYAALGQRKRLLSAQLLRRLADRFARHPLLQFGQGKLYPGESLPRWALSCYWRKDGFPLWEEPRWLAHEDQDYAASADQARDFLKRLASLLQVSPSYVAPAHEDIVYYLWREQRLPINVDPLDSRLENPEERARLVRVFSQGLGAVVGYALPLAHIQGQWVSSDQYLRMTPMRLVPGDSPMGYRLPLDDLPWVDPLEYPYLEPDPSAPRPPLPQIRYDASRPAPPEPTPRPAPAAGQSANRVVRTTLCAEPRQGKLYIFLPPLGRLEDFVDLVAAVEATARELELAVVIEGYSPPRDARLLQFSVTPDPGVIEVNIHPSTTWDDMVERTTILYEEARQCHLGTEKFMLDGRHSGTGGGNHIVLGGPTPEDSPLLRRPDLLKSMLTCWLNHPSLSYLFSGLFVGPTSQAPRLDEARSDSVYELELALRQMPGPVAKGGGWTPAGGAAQPPWLVDRILRHLLVDVSGNTHRAEFCIDKLYSPDTASGRLGLLELRSFEMPPHARMSLTQQLLLRALVARFWEDPDESPLVRWGTQLHDRFMLGHFVRQDFMDVLEDLRQHGYHLPWEWFEPHYEFRFPYIGSIRQRGLELELRTAIEPWHVLGEEPSAAGAVRYVDSSVERIQVLVKGLTDTRHVVTCNGRLVPLHPTGTPGEFVAGVRYRAWQPPSCLHPTIGVDAPLVFDLHDSWSQRSIGGCTYFVAHPGGRSHDSFPVNALEAESRRANRFLPFGHSPGGPHRVAPRVHHGEHPFTLDLRA